MSSSRQRSKVVGIGVVFLLVAASPAWALIGSDPVWQSTGAGSGEYFGYSVATAGDVNGDGYSDVIVGARNITNGQAGEGAAYLYLGSGAGLAVTPAWTYEGNQIAAHFGVCVAPAGDVNNDGYADVIIGADLYDSGESEEGAAFVFLGSAGGLDTTPAWIGQGNQAGAQFGLCVATAGDVNGDGYDDILIGAPFYDLGQSNCGVAFFYCGDADGVEADYQWSMSTPQANAYFGRSAATAGDVNADGYADVIVGANGYDVAGNADYGRAWVYLGSASGLASDHVWVHNGSAAGEQFGWCVATAGDTDGDGYSDIAVGAPYADVSSVDEGRVDIYRGNATGVYSLAARSLNSAQAGAQFGYAVAPAGDTNGDSFPDLIVGARKYDGGQTDEGRVYVYEGSVEGLFAVPDWTGERDRTGAEYGTSVATAGDVNGDGFSDVLAGTWSWDLPAADAGGAWLYFGSAEGLSTTPGWARLGDAIGAHLGYGVAIGGDVNGDGFSDVFVGAPFQIIDDMNNAGQAWGYLGCPVTPSEMPNWIGQAEAPGEWYGMELAAAGDVNGDGYGDLLVGAPEAAYLGNNWAGKVYLYLGSGWGLSGAPAWVQGGDASHMAFGLSVDGAGDVNGDGYADVLIGSNGHFESGLLKGRAFLYLGSADGLEMTPAWTVEGIAGSLLGADVAGAGDVNGDGYSDVIVGETNESLPADRIGQAFVYLGGPDGLPSSPAWSESLGQVDDGFGGAVAGAGDMNGDGYDEVIVGAPSYSHPGFPELTGAVAIYLGSASGPATSPSWFTWSDQADAYMGLEACGAGDLNGDGYSDVAFSGPGFDDGVADVGCVWIKLGSPAGPVGFIDASLRGSEALESFGFGLDGGGDVNGDGYDDLLVGSPTYSASDRLGLARIYFGNDRDLSYRGFPSIPRQQQLSDWSPIERLGRSEQMHGFQLAAVGQSPAGRLRLRMEWQAAESGTALTALPIEHGSWLLPYPPMPDWGSYVAMTAEVTGLSPDAPCHWRLRARSRSPFFPWTPWASTHGTVPSQTQVRTALNPASGVPGPLSSASDLLRLDAARPNPCVRQTTLTYELPAAGEVRVTIHDATGRRVRTLVEKREHAGRHSVHWDGRGDSEAPVAAGVYFARLQAQGAERSVKIVRSR